MSNYELIESHGKPIKAWIKGVPVEHAALQQLRNISAMPFIFDHVAAMPDVHFGIGATVGSVIATKDAIIPAAVGVDIGCGMCAVNLGDLTANDLPDSLARIRSDLEAAIPVGFAKHDAGNFNNVKAKQLIEGFEWIREKHEVVGSNRKDSADVIIASQLGTLGGGNHFIELCLDETDHVWLMLHSGSRGIGNAIGQYFINIAKEEMIRNNVHLPDRDLAYLEEGSKHFQDYVYSVNWAQDYARSNRAEMMTRILKVLQNHVDLPRFSMSNVKKAVNCHHNYVSWEKHFGQNVIVTRKGAVSAQEGEFGIIPGSMGAKSFIVRGKGNKDSFCSCSHGAGRSMSRGEAKRRFTVEDHIKATAGVECRKDEGVLDETPAAYKDIDAVMDAQSDLVEIVHTLKQILCIKG